MEDTIILYSSLALLLLIFALKLSFTRRHKNLPPSPPSLPIIGHLHLIKQPMHRILYSFSQKYGPIISLRFGSRLVVVVSSHQAAEECFTRNDIVFADRPKFKAGKLVGYNYTVMTQASYGDHWRNLRRITAIEILSSHRLNTFLPIRRDEIKRLLKKLAAAASGSGEEFSKVEMKTMFSELTFNVMMRMIAGKRYYGDDVEDEGEAMRFREIMKEAISMGGATNLGDFLPIISWIDGVEKKMLRFSKTFDAFSQELVDEHRRKKGGVESSNTMIDHLLSLQESQPEYYTDQIIKGLILVLLIAGTDTSSVTIEWAMSNLVNNPHVLEKAKAELDEHIGQDRLIDEPDLSRLHYLKSIVSETLRLYPAGPLLLPHQSSDDCTIGGYHIPRDTILLVNAWAIHRDPNLWSDPNNFKPERFVDGECDANKMMPFGLGRRSCPGSALAQRVVSLTLGSLIQCFEWRRVEEEKVDMTEGKGATMPKAKPLEVLCRARPIMNHAMAISD